jgi:hypothetical protein
MSPKEVESDLTEGENGGTVAIYDANGKGGGFGDQRHASSFIMGGYITRETKCKLSGPLDECYKEQWYQSELKIITHTYTILPFSRHVI